MKIDRAIEILNPEHRENYDGLDEVNEACRMGMEALERARWIPVSERLPELIKNDLGVEYSETVFVLTSGRKIMAAFLRRVPGDKAIWIAPWNFWEAWDEKITHWVEFPPLPEEKESPPEEIRGDEHLSKLLTKGILQYFGAVDTKFICSCCHPCGNGDILSDSSCICQRTICDGINLNQGANITRLMRNIFLL